jgi:AcrR family transcriptional regulator
MVDSAIELFRQHGYKGTGLRDVVAHSGAPWGSLHHYFPGGKEQLGVEALELAGDAIEAAFRNSAQEGDDFV